MSAQRLTESGQNRVAVNSNTAGSRVNARPLPQPPSSSIRRDEPAPRETHDPHSHNQH